MKKEDLYGCVLAIATPFNDKGAIVEVAIVELFEFLIGRGAMTICIADLRYGRERQSRWSKRTVAESQTEVSDMVLQARRANRVRLCDG